MKSNFYQIFFSVVDEIIFAYAPLIYFMFEIFLF